MICVRVEFELASFYVVGLKRMHWLIHAFNSSTLNIIQRRLTPPVLRHIRLLSFSTKSPYTNRAITLTTSQLWSTHVPVWVSRGDLRLQRGNITWMLIPSIMQHCPEPKRLQYSRSKIKITRVWIGPYKYESSTRGREIKLVWKCTQFNSQFSVYGQYSTLIAHRHLAHWGQVAI